MIPPNQNEFPPGLKQARSRFWFEKHLPSLGTTGITPAFAQAVGARSMGGHTGRLLKRGDLEWDPGGGEHQVSAASLGYTWATPGAMRAAIQDRLLSGADRPSLTARGPRGGGPGAPLQRVLGSTGDLSATSPGGHPNPSAVARAFPGVPLSGQDVFAAPQVERYQPDSGERPRRRRRRRRRRAGNPPQDTWAKVAESRERYNTAARTAQQAQANLNDAEALEGVDDWGQKWTHLPRRQALLSEERRRSATVQHRKVVAESRKRPQPRKAAAPWQAPPPPSKWQYPERREKAERFLADAAAKEKLRSKPKNKIREIQKAAAPPMAGERRRRAEAGRVDPYTGNPEAYNPERARRWQSRRAASQPAPAFGGGSYLGRVAQEVHPLARSGQAIPLGLDPATVSKVAPEIPEWALRSGYEAEPDAQGKPVPKPSMFTGKPEDPFSWKPREAPAGDVGDVTGAKAKRAAAAAGRPGSARRGAQRRRERREQGRGVRPLGRWDRWTQRDLAAEERAVRSQGLIPGRTADPPEPDMESLRARAGRGVVAPMHHAQETSVHARVRMAAQRIENVVSHHPPKPPSRWERVRGQIAKAGSRVRGQISRAGGQIARTGSRVGARVGSAARQAGALTEFYVPGLFGSAKWLGEALSAPFRGGYGYGLGRMIADWQAEEAAVQEALREPVGGKAAVTQVVQDWMKSLDTEADIDAALRERPLEQRGLVTSKDAYPHSTRASAWAEMVAREEAGLAPVRPKSPPATPKAPVSALALWEPPPGAEKTGVARLAEVLELNETRLPPGAVAGGEQSWMRAIESTQYTGEPGSWAETQEPYKVRDRAAAAAAWPEAQEKLKEQVGLDKKARERAGQRVRAPAVHDGGFWYDHARGFWWDGRFHYAGQLMPDAARGAVEPHLVERDIREAEAARPMTKAEQRAHAKEMAKLIEDGSLAYPARTGVLPKILWGDPVTAPAVSERGAAAARRSPVGAKSPRRGGRGASREEKVTARRLRQLRNDGWDIDATAPEYQAMPEEWQRKVAPNFWAAEDAELARVMGEEPGSQKTKKPSRWGLPGRIQRNLHGGLWEGIFSRAAANDDVSRSLAHSVGMGIGRPIGALSTGVGLALGYSAEGGFAGAKYGLWPGLKFVAARAPVFGSRWQQTMREQRAMRGAADILSPGGAAVYDPNRSKHGGFASDKAHRLAYASGLTDILPEGLAFTEAPALEHPAVTLRPSSRLAVSPDAARISRALSGNLNATEMEAAVRRFGRRADGDRGFSGRSFLEHGSRGVKTYLKHGLLDFKIAHPLNAAFALVGSDDNLLDPEKGFTRLFSQGFFAEMGAFGGGTLGAMLTTAALGAGPAGWIGYGIGMITGAIAGAEIGDIPWKIAEVGREFGKHRRPFKARFADSQAAQTMRQRGMQAIYRSQMNARSAFGNEALSYHA